MMTMYLTPYRRKVSRQLTGNDQIVRNFGLDSDIHVPMDILEEKDAYVILATLPGLTAEDIDIEIVKNSINISGEFKKAEDEKDNYLRRERPSGSFRRYFRFSTVLDAAKAEAKLENGMLTLRLPKVEEELPKSIKVKTK